MPNACQKGLVIAFLGLYVDGISQIYGDRPMDISVTQHKTQRKKGWASFCVDTRSIVENGKRNYFVTREEAQAFADNLKKELTPNLAEAWDWDFKTLQDRFERHLENQYRDGDIELANLQGKKRHVQNFVNLNLGGAPLLTTKVRDLTAGQVRLELMDQLRTNSRDAKRQRTRKTVLNIIMDVRAMFDYAMDAGCRNTNPMDGVKPKGAKKMGNGKHKRIQPDIIDAIISAMPEHWALRARFAATTGLRQGEQRALRWAHVDLESGFVRVQEAVKSRAGVGDTKTVKGNRRVPLTPDVKKLLQELYLRTGRPDDDQLVFPSATGHMLSQTRFLVAIHRACDAAGVERIRWHDLRHYYASRILQAFDGDWWAVTNLMGHTSIKTTTDTYGHWLETAEQNQRVADTISQAF